MKTPQILCLLFVLTFACSCSKTDDSETEEPSVVEQSYHLTAILTDKQSLHFTYNEQGQVSHSEEKDTLSENTRYNVERDYSYVLTDGFIFSRSVYHREGEWGTNNRELDYRDTLFLNKQQRVDSIHRHLIADGHIQQWFVLWYKYDDDGQLTELSMKSSQGTGKWSQWQRRGTLVWQDGCVMKYAQPGGQPDITYTYTNLPNDLYIDARSNLVWNDWIPLLQWFGRKPIYLQQTQERDRTLDHFSYLYQDGRIVSETQEIIRGEKTVTGVLYFEYSLRCR